MNNDDILFQIESNLTGNKKVDIEYLHKEIAKYKAIGNIELAQNIATLIVDYLKKEEIDELRKQYERTKENNIAKYNYAKSLSKEKKYNEALPILEDLVFNFLKYFVRSDEERYHFHELIEFALFYEMNNHPINVQTYQEPITLYMHSLAEIYFFTERLDDAINILEQSLVFGPTDINNMVLLSVSYIAKNKIYECFEISKEILKYSYNKIQLATSYQNIGLYFAIHQKYDIAIACYLTSNYYVPNKRNLEKIIQITKQSGLIRFDTPEQIINVFHKYNIQHGPSELVITTLKSFYESAKKMNNVKHQEYFNRIAKQLTDNELDLAGKDNE